MSGRNKRTSLTTSMTVSHQSVDADHDEYESRVSNLTVKRARDSAKTRSASVAGAQSPSLRLLMTPKLHAVHRGGKFMLERSAYMRRKKYAMEHPDRIMSIIIDKMDQAHCVVPYKGTQTQLNHALKIGLTGVKEHGVGVTFYRTIDSVTKGANLTVHCIAAHLEAWIQRHDGKAPEEIFIQVTIYPSYI